MYEKLYKEFYDELNTAKASFLLWKKINDSTGDKKILASLNHTPTSWLIIRHSLQVTFLITLHRIFETGDDIVSADKLLVTCRDNIKIFSKKELEKRKCPKGIKAEWVDDYIANAFIPTVDDINRLRGELRKFRKIFNDIYRPIRNKVIAHNLISQLDKTNELFEKTNIDEIEDLITFLNALKEVLYELYENGKKPDLKKHKLDKRHYEDDYSRLMSIISSV